jgi:hypothetical protein
VIRVHTGRHRTIAAALAEAMTLRAQPQDPVTWRMTYEVDRLSRALFFALLRAGRVAGLEITDQHTQGLWYRRGVLTIRGCWQDVSRLMWAWQRVTGQR